MKTSHTEAHPRNRNTYFLFLFISTNWIIYINLINLGMKSGEVTRIANEWQTASLVLYYF